MTFLAHWKMDEGNLRFPTTAYDSAAGGSGAHDASYDFGSNDIYGRMVPGGVGGYKLRTHYNTLTSSAFIKTPANIADLRLLGEMTVMCWITPDEAYKWNHNYRIVGGISGTDATEAQNDLWLIRLGTNREILFSWEKDAGVGISTVSGSDALPDNTDVDGFSCHLAVVRKSYLTKLKSEFYINGSLVATDDNSGVGFDYPTGGGSSVFYVGRSATAYNQRNFYLDSFRIYDTAEDVSSIQSVYNAEKVFYVGLDSGLAIPDGDDTTVEDSSSLHSMIHTGEASGREFAGFYK